mmetsp:Transcript_13681/g.12393  ORF Transcript_13681/g.12393 Transcript_13681/m.12393 type:complete len:427 (-) Transcript_13681:720-2000(-)
MGNKFINPSKCLRSDDEEDDKEVLINIFNQTNGKRWKNKIHWCEDNVSLSQWHHIKEIKGKVVRINLTDNNLTGNMPNIDRLQHLKDLQINQNLLTGEFPWNSLCCIQQLEIIDISNNQFTGELPWDLIFSSLRHLQSFNASNNYFQGMIPDEIMTNSSPKLHFFDMHQNELSGALTTNTICFIDYMRSSAYLYLDLRGNKAFYIPDNIAITAISIQVPCIRLQHSSIHGTLPNKFAEVFQSVEYIDLSWNFLTGELPLEMLKHLPLVSLNLEHNLFTGQISNTISEFKCLKELNLASNRLSGKLPKSLSRLWQLVSLDLHSNQFSGLMPRLAHLSNLQTLHLDFNPLVGTDFELYCKVGWIDYYNIKLSNWLRVKDFVTFVHCYGLLHCLPGTSINDRSFITKIDSAIPRAFAMVDVNIHILQYL